MSRCRWAMQRSETDLPASERFVVALEPRAPEWELADSDGLLGVIQLRWPCLRPAPPHSSECNREPAQCAESGQRRSPFQSGRWWSVRKGISKSESEPSPEYPTATSSANPRACRQAC